MALYDDIVKQRILLLNNDAVTIAKHDVMNAAALYCQAIDKIEEIEISIARRETLYTEQKRLEIIEYAVGCRKALEALMQDKEILYKQSRSGKSLITTLVEKAYRYKSFIEYSDAHNQNLKLIIENTQLRDIIALNIDKIIDKIKPAIAEEIDTILKDVKEKLDSPQKRKIYDASLYNHALRYDNEKLKLIFKRNSELTEVLQLTNSFSTSPHRSLFPPEVKSKNSDANLSPEVYYNWDKATLEKPITKLLAIAAKITKNKPDTETYENHPKHQAQLILISAVHKITETKFTEKDLDRLKKLQTDYYNAYVKGQQLKSDTSLYALEVINLAKASIAAQQVSEEVTPKATGFRKTN